jgi:DNA mismatch endonuclease (patch repair protein)
MLVRRQLWALGYRYRTHYGVAGRPDIAFVGPKIAVFIDGDFWHGNAHVVRGRESLHDLFPSRAKWWVAKIRRNIDRDDRVTAELREQGWTVLRFWESQITEDADTVISEIRRVVDMARSEQV